MSRRFHAFSALIGLGLLTLAALVASPPLARRAEVVARPTPLRFDASQIRLPPPTLAELWSGRAAFALEVADTGLPMGESDTVIAADGEWWSYVHASDRSAGMRDACGDPVAFPGCVAVYRSHDAGLSFALDAPVCQFACRACPCDSVLDHPQQQQYPRVARAGDAWLLAYEFGARVMLRGSTDGLTWSDADWVFNTGVWTREIRPCKPWEEVRPHPFASVDYECLAGGPPGVFVDDGVVYIFAAMGQNPGALGCFRAALREGASGMAFAPCAHNPLFIGAWTYGPRADTGAASNAHFDFRTISSAEVVEVGGQHYMLYEGIRGPGPDDVGDNQFGLGLARAAAGRIDGPWERFAGNPLLADLPGNIGLGHADLVITPSGEAVLYTSLDGVTRSRLRLVWR